MRKWIILLTVAFLTISTFAIIEFSSGSTPHTIASLPQKNTGHHSQQPTRPKKIIHTSTGSWGLIWEENFDSPQLDLSKWTAMEREHNFNNELQYYIPANAEQHDGFLYLVAKKEKRGSHDYTSGLVNTKDKFDMRYGKIEIRAKYPTGKGLFPAIWMLPVSETYTFPEIDVLEAVGSEPHRATMAEHWQQGKKMQVTFTALNLDYTKFHTYGIEWERKEIRWYVDGKLVLTSKKGIPQEEMYLILNLAVGGNWPGSPDTKTVFPSSLIIDYVKVYEKEGS